MTRPIASALGLAAALAAAGCGPECPAEPTPCAPMADVRVALPDETPKAYELSVQIDDEPSSRCLLVLPLPNDWPAFSRLIATCIGGGPVQLYVQRTATADCNSSLNGTSCSVDAGPSELVLEQAGTPTRITLTLKDGDQLFAPRVIEPSYAEYRPDGPSCGSTCQRAETSLSLADLQQAP